jgi:5-oxoprolinase (ATP-hydrolysing) subunit A
VNDGIITAMSRKRIKMNAVCLVVHHDAAGVLEMAKAVRSTVEKVGGQIVPLADLVN